MWSPMTAEAGALVYPARMAGPVASRCLGEPIQGAVIAVFGPAFYVEAGRGIVCVGTAALEPGPINLVTAAPARLDWRAAGLAPGDRAGLSRAAIRIGDRLRVPLAGAAAWSPVAAPAPAGRGAITRGLAAFRAASSGAVVPEGLARFIDPDHLPARYDHAGRAAAGPVEAARRWLAGAFAAEVGEALDWARRLTGLGAGLTPAGDDFLGGMLIALNALGWAAAADRLWQGVHREASAATNAV
jgi:hypothetical protein